MKHSITILLGCLFPLVATAGNITFLDDHVKSVCVQNWDTNGDGELTMEEAAAVTNLNTKFSFDTEVIRFPELQYFTGLSSISTYDFYSCKNLRSIVLPSQITSIGSSAFFGCINLQEVVIPDAVKKINDYAFNGCTNLQSVTFPEGLTTIGDYAFSSCKSLQGIAIPSTVTSISASAFWSCSSLNSITVDPDNTVYDSREDCNAIIKTSTNTLQLGIANTVIPASVTAIGTSAFYGNSRLATIDIPEGVKTIDVSAFSGCTALTTVTLPSTTLTSIGSSAFTGCKKLTNIILPEGLKTIGDKAFQNCDNLKKIYIPSTVTSIDFNAFAGCSRLTKVMVASTTPVPIDASVFPYNKKATLYVPKGCLNVYRNTAVWKDFKMKVELADNIITAKMEPEQIYVSSTSTASLTVSLDNADFFTYHVLQMDITLPQHFNLDAGNVVLSDRCAGMTVSLTLLEDNAYRLICTSESASITGTSGLLFSLPLQMANNMAVGDYHGTIQNITLTDDYGTQQPLDDAEFSWSLIRYALGDVNHDGTVNITDVTLTVNHILGHTTPIFFEENADMDQDGNVNVTDITNIVNLILTNN